MREILTFALLGLGAGAVYAILGQGVVLIYRGSGVVNLAHGAFAMLGAYIFNLLRLDHDWSVAPALIGAVGIVIVAGVAVDQIVLRRIRGGSALARLMVTLGVVLVLEAVAVLLWSNDAIVALPVFASHPIDVLGVTVASYQLWLLGIAAAMTGALAAIWRFTRFGWVMEAVSERDRGVASLGWSTEMISAFTWGAGAALAALAGIFVAPLTGLDQSNLTLIVIPALAACLAAGFRSFGLTLVFGVLVGVLQSLASNYVHLSGAGDALPLVVVVLIMMVRGSNLPLRGEISDELPAVGNGRLNWKLSGACGFTAAVGFSVITSANWLAAFSDTLGAAIVLLSVVVVTGYAGQVSLGQYALAGIGALVAGKLVVSEGWPFLAVLPAGALAATCVAVLFALPALRARGVNLAIVTLALGLATQSLIFDNPNLAGAQSGLAVGGQSILGLSINPISHPGRYTVLALIVFVICAVVVANVRRGRTGRQMLAVRANERAASASGVNVFGIKLYAFALSGALAGIGGVILGFQSTSITFASGWDPITSITAVAEAVIGGIGFVLGSLGGAPLSAGSFGSVIALHFQQFTEYLSVLAGVGLFGALMANPDGLVGDLTERLAHRATRRRQTARKRPPDPDAIHHGSDRADNAPQRSAVAVKVPNEPRGGGLQITNLNIRYGGVAAVSDVTLSVPQGQVVGLIGPNGAGKTSLMDGISGFTRANGEITLDGVEINDWPAHRRAKAGLARSFQGVELFNELSIRDNVLVAGDRASGSAMLSDLVWPGDRPLPAMALAAINEFDLNHDLSVLPGELSYGRRRLVAIARAVAAQPNILMLDEPAAGLDDHESRELGRLVRRLADEWGLGILVIEHDMNFVMTVADRVHVLDYGRTVAEGNPTEIRRDPNAIVAYLGEPLEQPEQASEQAATGVTT